MVGSESAKNNVDEMTLDQKKKLLKEWKHRPYIRVGSYVDATDTTEQYLMAKVVEVDE